MAPFPLMKTHVGFLISVCWLCSGPTVGAQSFWIQFSGNRVVLDAVIEGIRGDSLVIARGRKHSFFPLGEVEKIRVTDEGSVLKGTAIGAGIGLVAGAVVGWLGRGDADHEWDIGTSALYIGVIGGIVGSVAGSADNGGVTIELGGMTTVRKKELLLEFLVQYGRGS